MANEQLLLSLALANVNVVCPKSETKWKHKMKKTNDSGRVLVIYL